MPKDSPIHNQIAVLFIVFWVFTLAPCMKSWAAYRIRTVPVVLYALFTVPGHNRVITNIEWMADGMVWYHFFSALIVFGNTYRRKR